jgi:hypothetical protein
MKGVNFSAITDGSFHTESSISYMNLLRSRLLLHYYLCSGGVIRSVNNMAVFGYSNYS